MRPEFQDLAVASLSVGRKENIMPCRAAKKLKDGASLRGGCNSHSPEAMPPIPLNVCFAPGKRQREYHGQSHKRIFKEMDSTLFPLLQHLM